MKLDWKRRLGCLEREAGQSLAEFSLVFLLFVLVIMGIVDLSRAFYAQNVVTSAAREAARWAAVNGGSGVDAAAKAVAPGLQLYEMTVIYSEPDSRSVQVDVTYIYRPVSAWIARFLGDSGSGPRLVLHSRSIMRKEGT